MRAQKLSLVAVALAAGLSLTACQDTKEGSVGANDSSSSEQSSGGSSASDDNGSSSTGGSDKDSSADSAMCKTSQLGMNVSHGMSESDRVVHLQNNGSESCTLKGFPGVDLKNKDGSFSVDRSKSEAPTVNVKPGEETSFTLHVPRNDSGGHGVDMTSMVVTPPNETHSKTMPVRINLAATDGESSEILVDPIGADQ